MIGIVFILIFATLWKEDYFAAHSYYVVLIGIGAIFFGYLRKFYRLSFVLAGSYFCLSCFLRLERLDLVDKDYLIQNYYSTRTLLVCLVAGIFTHITRKQDERPGLAVLGSFMMWITCFRLVYESQHVAVGLFNNTSVNVAMIAVLLPYCTFGWGYLIGAFGLFLWDGGRTPWVMLILYATISLISKRKWKPILGVTAASCILLYKNGLRIVPFSDRLTIWNLGLQNVTNYYLGNGVGSWYVEIPKIQKNLGDTYYFTAAHNDWLQLLFETGIPGLALVLWMVADSLYCALKREPAFYSLVGLAVFATFFFPTEMPAVLFLWIFLMQRNLRLRPSPVVDKKLTDVTTSYFQEQ